MLASVVGPHTAAIAFRAAMNLSGNMATRLEDVGFYGWKISKLPGAGKYATRTHRLGYDQVQVTVWAHPESGFLPCVSEEAIWQLISSPPFTTPLKREWVPWLIDAMENRRMIRPCNNFNCNGGMVYLSPENLDTLVSDGLRQRSLRVL